MQNREERLAKHKVCPYFHEHGPEEEDNEEKEVMAAMWHSSKTYSATQANRLRWWIVQAAKPGKW